MICKKCNSLIDDGLERCPFCDEPIQNNINNNYINDNKESSEEAPSTGPWEAFSKISMIFGVVSLILFFILGSSLGIISLIFGSIAYKNSDDEEIKSRAKTGKTLGLLSFIFSATSIFIVFFLLAI